MSITAYHGTGAEFTEFQCPCYFTNNRETAAFFANAHNGNARVLTCSLTFQNPLIVDLGGQSWGGFFLEDTNLQEACAMYSSFGDEEEEEYFRKNGLTINFLAEYAELLGYDGLVANNCYEEDGSTGTQYVALNSKNIVIEATTTV